MLEKPQKRYRRHRRVRAKILGTKDRPRLSVYRSLKHIYAQLIDDENGTTLTAASDLELKKKLVTTETRKRSSAFLKKFSASAVAGKTLHGKVAIAYEVGKLLAQKALKKKIKKVVFDRGGFLYHGRIRALAEGAREGGLEF